MRIFQLLSRPFVILVERYYPDPFVFAILLSYLTLALAVALTPATIGDALSAWGTGLSSLLAFTNQICLTMIAAHALAHTDAVRRLLDRIGDAPRSARQAYALVVAAAGLTNLVSGTLGLVVGAILARRVGERAARRGLRVHYPLLVASAYAGNVVWHMGYSGSAPLFVATAGHSLEAEMGIVPVTATIFTASNIAIALAAVAAITIVCPLMHPPEHEIRELQGAADPEPEDAETSQSRARTPAQWLETWRPLSLSIALLLLIYLVDWFARRGFDLNLNIVIWTFVCAGLVLARSAVHYVRLIVNASTTVALILMQYPFYAGITGIIKATGLGSLLSGWFASMATVDTLPLLAFLSAGLLNIFVPSGGAQWVVQGPVFVEAAQSLGVDPATIVLAVAYGDQWTNLVQPFWAIPLLAIAGLNLRQIMGYTFVVCLLSFFVFAAGLLFLL